MSVYGTCEKCGEVVADPETPAFPIRGWEVSRSQGGANAIRLRERVPNRVRHTTCLPKSPDDQSTLFEVSA